MTSSYFKNRKGWKKKLSEKRNFFKKCWKFLAIEKPLSFWTIKFDLEMVSETVPSRS